MDNLREIAHRETRAGLAPHEIEKKYGLKENGKPHIPADTVRKWIKRLGWEKDKKKLNRTGQQDRTTGQDINETPTPPNANKIFEVIPETAGLTEKQRLFCIEYLDCLNATKAYQKVYGCTYDTAKMAGCTLLTKSNIQAEIDRLRPIVYADLYAFNADSLVRMHHKIATANLDDFIEIENIVPVKDGKPVLVADPNAIDLEAKKVKTKPLVKSHIKLKPNFDGMLVSSISEGRDGIKITLADQKHSRDWLAKNWFKLDRMDNHKVETDNRNNPKAEEPKQEKHDPLSELTLEELRALLPVVESMDGET